VTKHADVEVSGQMVKALNKREMFGDQTTFGGQTVCRLATLFGAVRSCLVVFDKM